MSCSMSVVMCSIDIAVGDLAAVETGNRWANTQVPGSLVSIKHRSHPVVRHIIAQNQQRNQQLDELNGRCGQLLALNSIMLSSLTEVLLTNLSFKPSTLLAKVIDTLSLVIVDDTRREE